MAKQDTSGEDFYLIDGFPFYEPLSPEYHVRGLKDMTLHKDDIFVAGFPKSGKKLLGVAPRIYLCCPPSALRLWL